MSSIGPMTLCNMQDRSSRPWFKFLLINDLMTASCHHNWLYKLFEFCLKGQSHEMDQALFDMIHSSRPSQEPRLIKFFWGCAYFIQNSRKFPAVNAKHRQITYICTSAFFCKLTCGDPFPLIFIYSVWTAAGRRLLLVKQVQVSRSYILENPPANRKQARVISLNTTSVPYGKKLKTTPPLFLRPRSSCHFNRAQSISWDCPFQGRVFTCLCTSGRVQSCLVPWTG